MFDNAKTGMSHNIPINTNFKVFKFFSVSTGMSYEEIWTQNTIKYSDFNIETNSVAIDTINKVGAFRQYSLNASVGTTIYGTVNFKEGSKIQSIRHTLRPNIGYSNRPSSKNIMIHTS